MLRAISGKTGNLAPIRPDMTNVTFQEKKGYGFGVDRLDVSNSKDKSDKLIRLCLIPKGAAIRQPLDIITLFSIKYYLDKQRLLCYNRL
jgi:hypothetical protein